ncbi:DnaJ protein [Gautieria morchelliformis]|nr:DnaJ protein [Gautieria morchelliformis]
MPPRLPAHRALSYVASTSSCSRVSPHSFAHCGVRRPFSVVAPKAYGSEVCLKTSYHGPQQKRAFHSSSLRASPKSPYDVLGLKKDAGTSEIKKAYYQLAKQFHPDTNKDKGAHERFVEIQAAYDLLSDDKKRAAYDQYGAASQQEGFNPDGFAQNGRGPFGAGGFGFQDFAFGAGGGRTQADLFETLFGLGGRGGRSRGQTENYRGDDIDASVTINFLEACKGARRSINVNPVLDCKTCLGSGLKYGAKRSTCASCGGTGTRTFVIESGFQMASTCSACQGVGTTVPRGSQCVDCSGLGKVRVRKTVQVDIPPGVEDGMTIRIPGAGDTPISGKGSSGDLLVRVNVGSSKVFRRQGVNIYHDARIPMHTAILGGKARVPTLDGEVDIRVPAGTQQGEECVLKGRGVPSVMGGDKGDMFVAFSIQLPRSLSKRQRDIIQQYADEVEGRASAKSGVEESGTVNEDTADKHGADSFASSTQPSSSRDWLSRTWHGLKGLMGY